MEKRINRRVFIKGTVIGALTATVMPNKSVSDYYEKIRTRKENLRLHEGSYIDSYKVFKLKQNKLNEPVVVEFDISKMKKLTQKEAGKVITSLNYLILEAKLKGIYLISYPYHNMNELENKSGHYFDNTLMATYDTKEALLKPKWYLNNKYATGAAITAAASNAVSSLYPTDFKGKEQAEKMNLSISALALIWMISTLRSFAYIDISKRSDKSIWLVVVPV